MWWNKDILLNPIFVYLVWHVLISCIPVFKLLIYRLYIFIFFTNIIDPENVY